MNSSRRPSLFLTIGPVSLSKTAARTNTEGKRKRIRLCGVAVLVFVFSASVMAQQQSSGATDNGVTAAFSSTYSGGYPITGIDTVNLYNGRVSLNLPIGRIGGRGTVGYAPTVTISRMFVLRPFQYWSPAGSPGGNWSQPQFKVISDGYNDSYDYSNLQPWFLPSILVGRKTRDSNPSASFTIPATIPSCSALTKVYLRLPGGEIELRDATGWNGEPHSNSDGTTLNRGKLWHSIDGSQLLFVSDTDIQDETCSDNGFAAMNGINIFRPTGYLMAPDGSRYRFVQGQPMWVSDRNGNTITFTGTGGVTDSLGRKYQLSAGGITYKDHNGTDRTVTVTTGNLSTALRSDFVAGGVKDLQTLLPGVYLESPTAPFNPIVTKTVHLPNGLEYHFFYTPYGELARIELPTGGVIEYDYGAGAGTNGTGIYPLSAPQVYRVAVAHRIYDSPGHLESRQTFDYGFNTSGATVTSVKTYDTANNVVAYERHTFKGTVPGDFVFSGWYPPFDNGREITFEMLDAPGSAVLRRIDNTWQTLDLNGAPTQPPQNRLTHPTNLDCALTETKVTLPETNQVSKKTFAFDNEGNKTDTYEYDFGAVGSGSPGALIRRTHVDFSHDANYVQTAGPRYLNLLLRRWISSDAAGTNKAALIEFEYDNYFTYSLINRTSISGSCIKLNDAATSCLQASDSSYTLRGNLTKTTAYSDIPNSGVVTATLQYDIAGNAVKTIDAKGNPTTFDYTDSYGPPDGNARGNSGSQELNSLGQYSYAFPTLVTNALGHTIYSQFNYYIGQPVDIEGANGNVETRYYNDVLDRLTQVSLPDGGRTTYNHVDAHQCGPYIETRVLLDSSGRETDSYQFFDGLARPYRSFSYENQDTANPYITVDTLYGALGVPFKVSNPYRSSGCTATSNPLGRWTVSEFDTLGRAKLVTTPDGAAITTSYSGPTVTATDQHAAGTPGHQRRSSFDALGRVARMDEPDAGGNLGSTTAPSQPTSYTYDAINNLRKVEQGAQRRYFMYDSLGRLIRSKTPEEAAGPVASNLTDNVTGNTQWSMAYGYDTNGNVTARVDARNVTTTYDYDALNRNKTVRYTDGTKNIDRFYDGAINGKGHFWYSNYGADNSGYDTHLAIDQYDVVGRTVKYRQHFFTNGLAGPPFTVTRSYDKAGNVLSQTYASGHTANFTYDIMGRVASEGGNLGDGLTRTYAAGISYSEFGSLQQEQFGTQTPLYHKLHYNVRSQLNDIRLSTVAWSGDQWNWNRGAIVNYFSATDVACQTNECRVIGGPGNNGSLVQSQYWIPTNDSMSGYNYTEDRYAYDSLNRLDSVAEYHGSSASGFSGPDFTQLFDYDRWGNRTVKPSSGISNTQFDKADAQYTNRLYAPGDTAIPTMGQRGIQYDNAGNQTNDSYTGGGTRTYDAENRLKQAQGSGGQLQTYTYDADGRRVKRSVNGVETWQLYGIDGELLAEYNAGGAPFLPTTEYGYRGGELLVTSANGDAQRLSRFVFNLYYGAQQRDPTAAELQDKVNQLATAGAQGQSQLLSTASQIARSVFTQTNYGTTAVPPRTDVQFVTDLYYAYLQRAPDDGGLNWWAGQAAGSRVNVCNAFEASSEFQTLVATLYGTAASDNERTEHIVNNFYLGAYGTNASATQLQQQRDSLNAAAALGQAQVQAQAETFGRSLFVAQINDASLSNTQYVTNLYESFLQRGPDAGGLGFWSGQAGVGQGRQNVLNAFATCGAFRELAGTLFRDLNWLVPDGVGTPRMVVNKSGSLTGVKRHDYLPFGEENSAPTGGRTPTQGYGSDSVRAKFTQKERDNETGLDYFGARYYSSVQGRFTSVDPPLDSAKLEMPQSWNRYAYCLNNPLVITDPTGEKWAVQYNGNLVTFQWYDGDTIPTGEGWEGHWEEYNASIYFGRDEVLFLSRFGPNVVRVSKDVFNDPAIEPGSWEKLKNADPRNLTEEQKGLLTAGYIYVHPKTSLGEITEALAPLLVGALSESLAQQPIVPLQARGTLAKVEATGRAPAGYRGGRTFRNTEKKLPQIDVNGNAITYREYDIYVNIKGINRGLERIVTGSDGKAYYTSDHYKTFTRMK